ncbi:uncharacterized protein EV420DRAFT_91955 [Desarmillaria tabescens]|uniref:Uncharacterized protein n=1 Tax=Armillaria tabescens TaxID=1929756 RepID=A0AA39NQS4_ARMTA|nr:uncharacterized protein EV420DRAFT_91955 [Desarmillaria tabescens]KAK0470139.1 hypothetical protein EV420DRAFT_91955 [Desarmillaria tabescens]
MSLSLALWSSSASSHANSSLFEHNTSSDSSQTDCSSSLSRCTSEASTSERVFEVEFTYERVSFQPHSTHRKRPDAETVPFLSSDDDLGYEAEQEERIKSPSWTRAKVYTKKREGRRSSGARRVSAQGTPFGGVVGLGLGLPSQYSLSGDATISKPDDSPILPEKPRLVAVDLADSPSPILLPPPSISAMKCDFPLGETGADFVLDTVHQVSPVLLSMSVDEAAESLGEYLSGLRLGFVVPSGQDLRGISIAIPQRTTSLMTSSPASFSTVPLVVPHSPTASPNLASASLYEISSPRSIKCRKSSVRRRGSLNRKCEPMSPRLLQSPKHKIIPSFEKDLDLRGNRQQVRLSGSPQGAAIESRFSSEG